MENTCKTCINNDDGLCDRKGILVEDEDSCEHHWPVGKKVKIEKHEKKLDITWIRKIYFSRISFSDRNVYFAEAPVFFTAASTVFPASTIFNALSKFVSCSIFVLPIPLHHFHPASGKQLFPRFLLGLTVIDLLSCF